MYAKYVTNGDTGISYYTAGERGHFFEGTIKRQTDEGFVLSLIGTKKASGCSRSSPMRISRKNTTR